MPWARLGSSSEVLRSLLHEVRLVVSPSRHSAPAVHCSDTDPVRWAPISPLRVNFGLMSAVNAIGPMANGIVYALTA